MKGASFFVFFFFRTMIYVPKMFAVIKVLLLPIKNLSKNLMFCQLSNHAKQSVIVMHDAPVFPASSEDSTLCEIDSAVLLFQACQWCSIDAKAKTDCFL